MARPKGSKNKTQEEKVIAIIDGVSNLKLDEEEKQEAIDELEDLLGDPLYPVKEGKVFLGFHPITGAEVWK